MKWRLIIENDKLADEEPLIWECTGTNPFNFAGDITFLRWWIETSLLDFLKTAPKTEEYGGGSGSADLQLIGENLATLLGMHDAPDPVKLELGCWFYLQGKVARLVSDYQQGRPGKTDTWFDASVYAKMARRIQETGGWPS